jgi:hypothetical protein
MPISSTPTRKIEISSIFEFGEMNCLPIACIEQEIAQLQEQFATQLTLAKEKLRVVERSIPILAVCGGIVTTLYEKCNDENWKRELMIYPQGYKLLAYLKEFERNWRNGTIILPQDRNIDNDTMKWSSMYWGFYEEPEMFLRNCSPNGDLFKWLVCNWGGLMDARIVFSDLCSDGLLELAQWYKKRENLDIIAMERQGSDYSLKPFYNACTSARLNVAQWLWEDLKAHPKILRCIFYSVIKSLQFELYYDKFQMLDWLASLDPEICRTQLMIVLDEEIKCGCQMPTNEDIAAYLFKLTESHKIIYIIQGLCSRYGFEAKLSRYNEIAKNTPFEFMTKN